MRRSLILRCKRLHAVTKSAKLWGLSTILPVNPGPDRTHPVLAISLFPTQPKKPTEQPASLPSIFSPHGFIFNPQPQKIFVFHFLDTCKSRLQLRLLSAEGQQCWDFRNLYRLINIYVLQSWTLIKAFKRSRTMYLFVGQHTQRLCLQLVGTD